jgi:hypothetical protein
MKKVFLFFFIFFITLHANAQTGIFFQAIARDNTANPAKDRKIYVQSNIIQSSPTGTKVLIEEHQTFTDAFGIFNILVGSGTRVGGTVTNISTIDWSKGPYYLNLKIVITPVTAGVGWDYTKEWVDIGTTIFGTVPFALYSANTANINEKLNATDTTKMLEPYAKGKAIQVLSMTVDTKLATKDTAAMLAPYAKLSYNLDSNFLKKQIASLLGPSDTNTYTKQTYTDSALLKKMNVFDTSIYAKQTFVDAVNYTQQKFVETSLQSKFNLADTIKYTKKAYTDSALLTKLTSTGSAASLTNFPILNQNTTGNAATAIYAGNITATSNTTLTSLSNLNTVGIITAGVWSATTIDVAHGGTGLNTSGLDGQVLSTASDGSLQWVSLTSSTTTHRIGERFGGGIVFYVYDNGKHGLIAATSDQASFVRWGNTTAVNAIRDGINAGMANTERIILVQGSAGDYAAQIAANYQGGGFGDWYLPSKYELNLLFQKKAFVGLFPGFGYWSSNESGNSNAWGQDFSDIWGTQFYTNRTQKHSSVRAIRAF